MIRPRVARRTEVFTESVIRGMTRLASKHDAINLAQGFPNFSAPNVLKEAGREAIADDVNQYAITWGSQRLREALAQKYSEWYGMKIDPDSNITVTCGATEAMISTLMGIVNDGDEVVLFEPFYENYGPDTVLCGARPVFVPLPVTGPLDFDRIEAAFSERTRAVILNTPNNPSGRVLSLSDLGELAKLCEKYDCYAVTDEIYEHIRYEGKHLPIASLPAMFDRTITISGASKTFSVTGWRVGWIVAPADVSDAIRKVHDFLTVGAPAPLQEGVAAALEQLDGSYYEALSRDYQRRRDVLCDGLRATGFECSSPEGAYYVLAKFGHLRDLDDVAFAEWLTRDVGVATVPGSSFYYSENGGCDVVRFAFCKTDDMLEEAVGRLRSGLG